MYLERSDEENKKLVEGWKGDADGMLIFVGLQTASQLLRINVEF